MTKPDVDKNLARTVAQEVERLRRRRKLIWIVALLVVAALAILYGTCGAGFGIGGKGKGEGSGTGSERLGVVAGERPGEPGAKRCAVRVAAAGITVDGVTKTKDEAVKACSATLGADVVVTGDAKQGDWDDLRVALAAANVTVFSAATPPAPDSAPTTTP